MQSIKFSGLTQEKQKQNQLHDLVETQNLNYKQGDRDNTGRAQTDGRSIGRHRMRKNEEAEEQRLSVSVLFIISTEGRQDCGGDEDIFFPLSLSLFFEPEFYLFIMDLNKAMCGQLVLQPRESMNLFGFQRLSHGLILLNFISVYLILGSLLLLID